MAAIHTCLFYCREVKRIQAMDFIDYIAGNQVLTTYPCNVMCKESNVIKVNNNIKACGNQLFEQYLFTQ